MNIEICDTIKVESEYSTELMKIRTAAIKQKDWSKMSLMIIKSDKIIKNEDVLCMIWMNLNIVQYIIIVHTIDEMKVSRSTVK
jgi:hypothetical protein